MTTTFDSLALFIVLAQNIKMFDTTTEKVFYLGVALSTLLSAEALLMPRQMFKRNIGKEPDSQHEVGAEMFGMAMASTTAMACTAFHVASPLRQREVLKYFTLCVLAGLTIPAKDYFTGRRAFLKEDVIKTYVGAIAAVGGVMAYHAFRP